MDQKAPDIGSRIASGFLDHVLGLVLKVILWLPFFISLSRVSFYYAPPSNPFLIFLEPDFAVTFILGSALYYLKDVFNARSIGKRALGLQVVNNRTGLPASPVRTALRGFGLLLWVVEVILLLASPARRLGDLIAGTRVVEISRPQRLFFPVYQHLGAIVIAVAISAVAYLPLWGLGWMASGSANAPDPYYRTEEIKEIPAETENLEEFFREKYNTECESVILSSQGMPGSDMSLISGTFMLRSNLFGTGEVNGLKDRIRSDLEQKMSGKKFSADIAIIFIGDDEQEKTKLEFSSGE